jgi:hypothetical protein
MMFPPYSDIPRELLANGIRSEARWEDDTVILSCRMNISRFLGRVLLECHEAQR